MQHIFLEAILYFQELLNTNSFNSREWEEQEEIKHFFKKEQAYWIAASEKLNNLGFSKIVNDYHLLGFRKYLGSCILETPQKFICEAAKDFLTEEMFLDQDYSDIDFGSPKSLLKTGKDLYQFYTVVWKNKRLSDWASSRGRDSQSTSEKGTW